MSLPKRDGVKGRYYLIHKPDTSPEVLAEADLCIQDVLNGTARENHSDYPTVVRNHNGTPFLPDQLLERYGRPCHSGEDRRLIDRAKALLMDRHGITEEQAHYYLQKKSMDSRTKLAQTARLVLDSKTME